MAKDLNHAHPVSSKRPLLLTGMQFLARRTRLYLLASTQTRRRDQKRNRNIMANTGKNAYEIRLEVLQMAVNQADIAYYNQLDRARVIAGADKPYEIPEDKRVREALKIAKKLYAFVEGEGTSEETE